MLGGVVEVEGDAVLLHEPGGRHGQVLGGAAGEVRGQVHAVVGGPGLLAEHGDPVRGGDPALGECFEVALADHAVPDEHDRGQGLGHVNLLEWKKPASAGGVAPSDRGRATVTYRCVML